VADESLLEPIDAEEVAEFFERQATDHCSEPLDVS
jgi:hypothetical protein